MLFHVKIAKSRNQFKNRPLHHPPQGPALLDWGAIFTEIRPLCQSRGAIFVMHMEKKTKKGRLGLVLFGSIFLIAGLGVIALGPLHTFYLHFSSSDWARIPVTLEHIEVQTHSGSDSTTYSLDARYHYTFSGQHHIGTRVGYDLGSDNLSDFHQTTARNLKWASSRGQLYAWVNPDNPSEAYLVRDLRWKKMLFMGLFGLVFGAAGGGIMFLGRKSSVPTSPEAAIYSGEKTGFWIFGFMSFMFFALSLPAVLAIPDELEKNNRLILVVLLFPMVAAWLGYMSWKSRRDWRYYGPAPLFLDPAPGQIGGDIGGRITLSRQLPGNDMRVTLQCLRVRISGGKNSSRSETLEWQADQTPEVHTTAQGSELRFCFRPPEELPETDDEGRRRVVWRLLLKGPRAPVPLTRTYTLPVTRGSLTSSVAPSQEHVRHHERQDNIQAVAEAAQQIDVTPTSDGLLIHSRTGRNLGLKFMTLLFGLVFSGVAVGVWMNTRDPDFDTIIIITAFALFGFPMVLGGLFMAGRSLKALIRGNHVEVTRYWCGLRLWKRRGYLTDARQITLHKGATVSSGTGSTQYFSVALKSNGKSIRLAEGLAGRPVAEAFQASLIRLLGLH